MIIGLGEGVIRRKGAKKYCITITINHNITVVYDVAAVRYFMLTLVMDEKTYCGVKLYAHTHTSC